MSELEAELRKSIGFKKDADDYADRQTYLGNLVRTADKYFRKNSDDFDQISEELADWFNEAGNAMNDKEEILKFPDADESEADPGEGDETTDADGDADGEAGDGEESEDPDDPVDDDGEGEAVSDEEASAAAEAEAEAENEAQEAAQSAARKPKKGAPAKTKKEPPKKPIKQKRDPNRPTGLEGVTGEKDRFGVVKGTKTHEAVLLYEKGITAKNLKDQLGGRFYNILTRLVEEGHRVDKLEGGVWKLTHKDDIGAKAKPKKK